VAHVFTHFALELAVVSAESGEGEGEWWPIDRIDEAGLPTLFAKAAALAQSRRNSKKDPLVPSEVEGPLDRRNVSRLRSTQTE
jgi:hypothetical protein